MDETYTAVTSLTCKLSGLLALGKNSVVPETVFSSEDPVIFVVTVEFLGSGAIALMPLKPSIQVDFYAKCLGPGNEVELGSVALETVANQLIYTPRLTLTNGLGTAGLVFDKIYKISALLRVGCAGYPSLLAGFIEGLILQTYS